jgi:hypothetical protein
MAEVFGSIGNETVELNNAATEATLRLLLQSSLTANNQSIQNIKNLAQKSGLDPNAVAQANNNLRQVSVAGATLGTAAFSAGKALGAMAPTIDAITTLSKKLASGEGEASDVFNALGKLPGPFGMVAQAAGVLAEFQERQIKQYQQLTQSGINFGGSLTDLRLAASQTKMTMQEFTDFAKKNSTSLAMLGTTADDGAKAFVKVSKEFQSGTFANNLRALGYTSAEMNESLVKFMALQGVQGLQDAQRVQQVQVATAGYLTELDKLTQVTGISKKKLEEEQKKAEMNAAFQTKMAALGPAEQAKLKAAYDKAAATGIKGATDLVMATALGLPPITEASQQLTGVLPEAASGLVDMTNTAMTAGTTQQDVTKKFAGAVQGVVTGAENLGDITGAVSMGGGKLGETMNTAAMFALQMKQQGLNTAETVETAFKDVGIKQKTQAESQAAEAAKAQLAMRQLGESILNNLMPVVAALLPYVNDFAIGLSNVVKYFLDTEGALQNLGIVIGTVVAGFVALKTISAARAAKAAMRGTPGNPVHVTGPGLGGPGGPGSPGGPSAPGGQGGRLGKILGTGAKVLGKVAAPLAIGMSAYDAFQGFNADKEAEIGEKLKNAGSSVLSGLTFGMLGSSPEEIAARKQQLAADPLAGAKGKEVPQLPPGFPPISEAARKALAGEPEKEQNSAVALGDPLEKLATQLETLNKQATEMIRLLRITVENTGNTVSATRALNGNMFPVP